MEKLIVERFLKKFNRYKVYYNDQFLEERLKRIFSQEKIKDVFINYYHYNLDPENPLYRQKLMGSDKEVNFLKLLKKNINIDNFLNILRKTNLSDTDFEEEYFFAYSCLLFIVNRFGTVNNTKLFTSIVVMWILVDNIIDNPKNEDYLRLINSVRNFLIDGIYKKDSSELDNFFRSKEEDVLIQLLHQIYLQLDEEKRIPFFDSCKNLFLYSYNEKKNDNGTLGKSLKKSFLSIEIFLFCVNKENEITPEDYHTTCLFLQLLDDLLDVKKDSEENSETFVLKCSKEERSIIVLILLELNAKNLSPIYKPMCFVILQILVQNREYFDDKIYDMMNTILGVDLKITGFKNTAKVYQSIKGIFS